MPESAAWEYTLQIPNDPRAVTISRRTLRLILTMHGLTTLVDTAELLATELIANAVRHTDGPAALRVRCSAGVLRIGAWDANPEPPEPPQAWDQLTTAEDGRGLALVLVEEFRGRVIARQDPSFDSAVAAAVAEIRSARENDR
jgi:anti-sigma regulatory factor (Ser/Thr protein kinase)